MHDIIPRNDMIVDAPCIRDLSSAHSSKAMVGKIAVDIFEAVMPIQHDVAPIHALDTEPDELGDVIEVSLACRYVARVNITALKMRKENFTGIRVITMRSKNHKRQLELSSNGLEFLGLMIACAICHDDRGLAP